MLRYTRRGFLRGAAGVAIALPLMPSLMARRSAAAQGRPPRRIIFEFKPNGDQTSRRFVDTDRQNFAFDEFLEPLDPYRDELLILNRLDKRYSRLPPEEKADNHQQGGAGLAPWPSGSGNFPVGGASRTIGYVLGPSADYAMGERLVQSGVRVPFRHLVYRVGGRHNDIWNIAAHGGPSGNKNPIAPETDPQAAFDRLFSFSDPNDPGTQRQRLMRQSVLDLVLDETNALSRELARADARKLELHLDSLRDIERSLEPSVRPSCEIAELAAVADPYDDANHALVGQTFYRILSRALACDLTRIANFAWHGNTSPRVYANLGLNEGHHDISHRNDEAAFGQIRQIHRHLWQLSTGLYEELKSIPDGDGTLWDNTLVVHWNELGQGDVHSTNDQLVVFAGGNQGYFKRGELIDYDNGASFSDMLLSCFHYLGFEDMQVFGDERLADGGPLPEVRA